MKIRQWFKKQERGDNIDRDACFGQGIETTRIKIYRPGPSLNTSSIPMSMISGSHWLRRHQCRNHCFKTGGAAGTAARSPRNSSLKTDKIRSAGAGCGRTFNQPGALLQLPGDDIVGMSHAAAALPSTVVIVLISSTKTKKKG